MLKIRKEQMKALERARRQAFINRVAKHVREDYAKAAENLSDEVLKKRVANGIGRACRYGLTWESSIGTFVALMFEVAPNFDEHPPIQRILGDQSIPPDSRIRVLLETLPDEAWDEARSHYDAIAWHK